MKWVIVALLYATVHCKTLDIVSKTRTTFLEKYTNYIDVVVISFQVPSGSPFASFKFVAEEIQASIFSCSARKVSLYMKHGSLPVINPDNSHFPTSFKNITRSKLYNLEFESNKKVQYLNLTTPDPGLWYVTTFLSYSDPKQDSIQPQGLTPKCFAQVEADLFASKPPTIDEIVEDNDYTTSVITDTNNYYKFFVPELVDHALVTVDKIVFGSGAKSLTIRVQSKSIPSENNTIKSETIQANNVYIPFNTAENSWHFLEFLAGGTEKSATTFTFNLKYFVTVNKTADYDEFGTAISKIYRSDHIENVVPYKQYDLVRESSTESFSYTFDLRKKFEISSPVPVNLTSTDFTALKFELRDNTDIGGTLQFILAFKPRVSADRRQLEAEPENHKVIGCIRPNTPEIPVWPNFCRYDLTDSIAPLIVNKSVDNATVRIPYPETGVWFATFKLFCGECEPCDCPGKCKEEFKACAAACEATCGDAQACDDCATDCKEEVVAKQDCSKCDCEGPCIRSKTECNSSVLFDVSSYACVGGSCGKNGRCTFMVSDGIVYSTCVCSNNYRGWDCSDDSQANPYWLVVLELCLLVLSNLMFLPTVFVAYRRRFYVEALVYLSICFFSTFYHACDAGENIISFCITRLAALQFADFFCALLSIWVTLIAIADLPSFWPAISHILGSIILAFITTINKTSVWVFAVPAAIGVVIVGINWYLKYRKIKQMFINKRYLYIYLPVGVVVVAVGLVIFALLQTTENYKYLHSMWHILMAVAVIVLLPRFDTFQPETML